MRQVLALCTALVFTLSLAGAALAQGTSSPSSSAPAGSSATSPSSSSSTTDTTKSTAPSGTDAGKSTTGAAGKTDSPKSSAGKPMAAGARGQHKIMGEVTKIDEAKGTVSLKTDEGDMDLHFPPSALKGIKEGHRVEVQLAIRPAGGGAAGSKAPAKGSSSDTSKTPSASGSTAKPKTP